MQALVLARGGQDPGGGISALLIVLVVLAVIVMVAVIFGVFHRMARASKGGVEPVPGEFTGRGKPPFESFGRRRK